MLAAALKPSSLCTSSLPHEDFSLASTYAQPNPLANKLKHLSLVFDRPSHFYLTWVSLVQLALPKTPTSGDSSTTYALIMGALFSRQSARYTWQPLPNSGSKAFRILLLNPGKASDGLSGTLETNSLESNASLEYETISYAWGDTTPTARIDLDTGYVMIPETASEALRRVRSTSKVRRVWIDSVCIDQDDNKDRRQQVALIVDIFYHSRGNLIHLGEEDIGTSAGLDTVNSITSKILQDHENLREIFYDRDGGFKSLTEHLRDISGTQDNEALFSIYRRAWFSRLWVVQEAALAPLNTCLIGKKEIPLFKLLLVAAWHSFQSYSVTEEHKAAFNNALLMFDLIFEGYTDDSRRQKIERSLDYCMVASRHFFATEPPDHVFALRGLLRGRKDSQLWSLLQPDYDKSLSLVFADATQACMLDENSRVQVLRKVIHSDAEDVCGVNLPSWVLRFEQHQKKDGVVIKSPAELSMFKAGTGSPPQLTPAVLSSTFLHVKGMVLGSVLRTGPELKQQADHKDTLKFVLTSADIVGCENVEDSSSELARKLASIFAAGVNSSRQPMDDTTRTSFFSWITWLRLCHNADSCNSEAGECPAQCNDLTKDYHKAALHASSGRQIFITDDGLVGLSPRLMQEGDLLVLLYEADVPCILRPAGGEHYHFVGSCYVEGIIRMSR